MADTPGVSPTSKEDAADVGFLRGKEIPNLVSDAVVAMVEERPENPCAWLAKYFQQLNEKQGHPAVPQATIATSALLCGVPRTETTSTTTAPGSHLTGDAAMHIKALTEELARNPSADPLERITNYAASKSSRSAAKSLLSQSRSDARRKSSGAGRVGTAGRDREHSRPQVAVGPEPELVLPLPLNGDAVRIDALPVHSHVVVILCSESGRVIFWNRGAFHATGIPSASAEGQNIEAFVAEGAAQLLKEIRAHGKGIKHELSDFKPDMRVWHDLRRDGVVKEVTETELQVQYATGDKHRYQAGSLAKGKLRPMDSMDDEETVEDPKPYFFTRVDGIHRMHLMLQVQGGPTPGYAALVGVPQKPDLKSWVLEEIKSDVRQLSRKAELKAELARVMTLTVVGTEVDTEDWAPLRLQALMSRLASDIYPMASNYGVDVTIEQLPSHFPSEIYIDGQNMAYALGTLLNNAVRFSGDADLGEAGGRCMTVPTLPGAHSGEAEPQVWMKATREGPELVVRVGDHGPGLPEEVQKVLRGDEDADEDCAKTLRKAMSTVSNLGGRLTYKAVQPQGAEFAVYLPLVPANQVMSDASFASFSSHYIGDEASGSPDTSPCAAGRRSPGSRHSPSGRRASVPGAFRRVPMRCLVVIPSAVHRMSLAHHLWERSYTLQMAPGPGMPLLEELEGCDLVIVDIMVGFPDTAKLFEDLREVPQGCKVLLAHTRDFNQMQKQQIETQRWFILRLPICPGDLSRKLDEVETQVAQERKARKEQEELVAAFSKGIKHVPWEKGRQLGRGSFGAVYEAICKMTGGRMAVKVVQIARGAGPDSERALLGEVELMAQLDHDNILRYFYAERAEEELHIFMEFATDGSLKGRIPPGGMDAGEAAHFMCGILKGLVYLHDKGIVHRDIKPDNVLISGGVPKLCDFGTAARRGECKALSDFDLGMRVMHDTRGAGEVTAIGEDKITVSFEQGGEHRYGINSVAQGKLQPAEALAGKKIDTGGTPHFMAPEVLDGQAATPFSDVWACGCLLMELASGKGPFAHKGEGWMPVRYVSQLKEDTPLDLGPYEYHPVIRDFILRCLKVKPAARPRCSALLKDKLASIATEAVSDIGHHSPSPSSPPQPSPREVDPWASDEEEDSVSDGWGVAPEEPREQHEERREADAMINSYMASGLFTETSAGSHLPSPSQLRRASISARKASGGGWFGPRKVLHHDPKS